MGKKIDIDEDGNIFKIDEDGTIVRVGKINEDGISVQKTKKPILFNKQLHKVIIGCSILLWVAKVIIDLFLYDAFLYDTSAYIHSYENLCNIAAFVTVAILILFCIKKINLLSGLMYVAINTHLILITVCWPFYWMNTISTLVVLALVYMYKFERLKNNTKN